MEGQTVWLVLAVESLAVILAFLYVLHIPLSALTLHKPLPLLPSQTALMVALIAFNDFKSLLLMSSLSAQNAAPLTASNSLLNPLSLSDHSGPELDKLSQVAFDVSPEAAERRGRSIMLSLVSERFCW